MRYEQPMHDHTPDPARQGAQRGSGGARGKRRLVARAVLRAERRTRAAGRANDRGTVLLMVLGVLALMAIIAVAYAALGKADRASSSSLVRTTRIDDLSDQISQYLAGIIRDDLFSTYTQPDGRTGTAASTVRLETWDYPYVDPQMVSDLTLVNPTSGRYRFNAAGGFSQPWTNTSIADPRRSSDPWLSATEPCWLNEGVDAPTDPNRPYLDKRDWRSISNFAPSGNFVNLANLRNNFRAESGFDNDATGRPRMSERLGVFNQSGAYQTITGQQRYTPSVFSSNQHGAFRPMVDGLPAEDPRHINNQWCDTDGDGFADARWFELVDVFDRNDPLLLLPANGRARLFLAARAMDLSGLVNINTAGDLATPPGLSNVGIPQTTVQFLVGQGPQDVDLLRLLSLSDPVLSYGQAYDGFAQPPAPGDAGFYGNFGAAAVLPGAEGAMQALYDSRGVVGPGTGATPAPVQDRIHRVPDLLVRYNRLTPLDPMDNPPPSAWDRFRYFDQFASTDEASRRLVTTLLETRSLFDPSDLLELTTFHGVNDSSRLSRLEAITAGRAAAPANLRNYDPLRSNRPRSIEMLGRGSDFLTNAALRDQALFAADIDVRRLLTAVSGARPLSEPVVADADANPINLSSKLKVDLTTAVVNMLTGDANLKHRQMLAVFRAYADALMPYTDEALFPDAWNLSAAPAYGRSYGGRAELAYRIAAHMAINFRDAFGEGPQGVTSGPRLQEPTVASLDMTRSAADRLGSQTFDDRHPWPRMNLDDPDDAADDQTALRRLTPDDTYIQSVRIDTGDPRLTLFGVKPQPFLSHVTAMSFFVDAPPNMPGATDDSTVIGFDATGNPIYGPVTIDVRQSLTNPDFLFSVIAFQITNPFDVDIELDEEQTDLNQPPRSESFYYVEYAGRTWRLTPQPRPSASDPNPTTPSGLAHGNHYQTHPNDRRLKAGQTKVFFATFPATAFEVEQRVQAVRRALASRLTPGSPPTGSEFKLDKFAEHELGKEAVHIPLIYAETGHAVQNGGSQLFNGDLHATDFNYQPAPLMVRYQDGRTQDVTMPRLDQNRPERRVVMLWRAMRDAERPDGSLGRDRYGEPPLDNPNDRSNDQLIDRLRDPSDRTLNPDGVLAKALVEPFGQGNYEQAISGSRAGDDSQSATALDNTGFTFAAVSSISRPSNPLSPTVANPDVPRGIMPPWCMELKEDSQYFVSGTMAPPSINKSFTDNRPESATSFRAGTNAHFETLQRMIDRVTDDPMITDAEVDSQLNNDAKDRTNNGYDVVDMNRESRQPAGTYTGRTYMETAPVFRARTGAPETRALFSRIGDMLLPLAIGPSFDAPDPNVVVPPAQRIQELERRWLTLSEALALAADYYSPTDPMNPLHGFGRDERLVTTSPPANPQPPKAERGCLVTDAWAPYIERGNDFVFEPGVDEPLGNGIPLAANVLGRFRVASLPGYLGTSAYAINTSEPSNTIARTQAYGSLTQAVPGVININTAPLSVLRMLAMVSPDLLGWLNDGATASTAQRPWLAADVGTGTAVPAKLWDVTNPLQTWDLAATMIAYRDRAMTRTRRIGGGPRIEINLRDDRTDIPGGSNLTGRQYATGIRALRDGPGFKSLGEIMALEIKRSSDPAVQNVGNNPLAPMDVHNSITRLGRDGLATVSRSIDPAVVRDVNNANLTLPETVVDDPAEKLSIANAVLNSISVRSDLFCVWFVIQGYTPEDTAVEDGLPMVPSISRRYVMVVDRSNVVNPSDRPRIVMLRELPLR